MEAQVEGYSLINYESVYINDYILYICYLKGVKKCLDTAADPGKILGGAEQHISPTAARS